MAPPPLAKRWFSLRSPIAISPRKISNYGARYLSIAWRRAMLADDWLYPDCIERMVEVANDSETIGIVSAHQRWGNDVHLTSVPLGTNAFTGHSVVSRTLRSGVNITGGPTAVLYRTPIILERDSFYDWTLETADTDAALRTLLRYDLGFVHRVLTYARRQGDSQIDWSREIGSFQAEDLLAVVRFGSEVLDARTNQRIVRFRLARYAAFLLRSAFRAFTPGGAEFRNYHLLQLREPRRIQPWP